MNESLPNSDKLIAKWKSGVWCYTCHQKTFKILILEEGEDYTIVNVHY